MAFKVNENTTSSVNNRNSRYVQGGETNLLKNRTGWWERKKFVRQDDDIRIVIEQNEGKRPDLISNRIYGKAIYAWVVLEYNNIVDVETEMLPGKELFLPTQQRLILDIITRPTGGKRNK